MWRAALSRSVASDGLPRWQRMLPCRLAAALMVDTTATESIVFELTWTVSDAARPMTRAKVMLWGSLSLCRCQ